MVERIVDSTELPVLVDGDGGFGNFNNARILARRLRQRGAAGVALEDSCFPKMNSFVGDRHPLADIDEFSGRLRAVKDTVRRRLGPRGPDRGADRRPWNRRSTPAC